MRKLPQKSIFHAWVHLFFNFFRTLQEISWRMLQVWWLLMIVRPIVFLLHWKCQIRMMLLLVGFGRTCLRMGIKGKSLAWKWSNFNWHCYLSVAFYINGAYTRRLDIFICGDQIRKGAALNAIQIAEMLLWLLLRQTVLYLLVLWAY